MRKKQCIAVRFNLSGSSYGQNVSTKTFYQKSVITTTAPKIEALFTSASVLLFHALFIVIQRRRSFLKAAVDFFFRRIDTSFGGYCNTKYIKVIIFLCPWPLPLMSTSDWEKSSTWNISMLHCKVKYLLVLNLSVIF